MHVVEVNDRVGVCSDLVPIATLHPLCQPMVSVGHLSCFHHDGLLHVKFQSFRLSS